MVELDVQWGDGADLENLGVERRADRVISSAKCAQMKKSRPALYHVRWLGV
jgi:hypothetical protein